MDEQQEAAGPDARLAAESDARLAAESDARLAAVFRAAAAGAPPPGFDAGDVVSTSRRITRRRRSALAGAALAVLAVAGVGVTAGLSGEGRDLTVASAGNAPEAVSAPADARSGAAQEGGEPGAAAQEGGEPGAAVSDAASVPGPDPAGSDAAGREGTGREGTGREGTGREGAAAPAPVAVPGSAARAGGGPPVGPPLGPGTGECADRQDPALRVLVAQVLPEAAGAPEAATTMECRPGGERGLALEVRDGTSSGLLTVTSLPAGEAVRVEDGARTAPSASGGTVVVASRSTRAGDPAPFADRLDAVLAHLAPRL